MIFILVAIILLLILALLVAIDEIKKLKSEFDEYRLNMETRLENILNRKLTKSERH